MHAESVSRTAPVQRHWNSKEDAEISITFAERKQISHKQYALRIFFKRLWHISEIICLNVLPFQMLSMTKRANLQDKTFSTAHIYILKKFIDTSCMVNA